MARGLTAAFALAGFAAMLTMASMAQAQLPDPTRPPPAIAAPTDVVPASTASGLQSVILRLGGKPAALINGEVVEVGGLVGEARVVRIEEDRVVLQGPEGEETLRLMPAAAKKLGAGGTAPAAAQTAKHKKKGAD